MRNQYGGKCYRCGEWVAPGAGHFEKARGVNDTVWIVQHASCAIEHRGDSASRTEAINEKILDRAGIKALD